MPVYYMIERIEMYRIKLEDYKIHVVCEKCYQNGEIQSNCNKCGGKGTHFKTKQKWIVFKHLESVEKIDRDKNGNLRYWTDASCFFEEDSKLLHFTYKDAQRECDRRNRELGL